MKTRTFTPTFYLANKEFLFTITSNTTIGRSSGDIVLEEDEMLSSVHCEFIPRLLEFFVKDLNSTNGTFVNEQKIFPVTEVKIKVGDKVKFGNGVYTVFDNLNEAKKVLPGRERRKNPRPDNYYGLKNFVTFYAATKPYQAMYVGVLMLTIISFAINLDLGVTVPSHLEFISRLYAEQIVNTGIRTILFVYLISIAHALIMQLYFNRNPLRKIFSFVMYAAAIATLADFAYGPLGGIKQYAIQRQKIESIQPNEKAIVYLKTLTDHKVTLHSSFKEVRKLISDEEKAVLTKDHDSLIAKLDKEINKLDKLLK